MDHRHGRTVQTYYLCPTAQGGSLLLQYGRRLGPTRIDTTLTRGVEAALARPRTRVLLNYGWLLRPLQPAIPSTCRCCNSDAAQQARNEPRTETPPPPAGPHPATVRRPADCPVCGKHCGYRASVVMHGSNVRGITRSQALWKSISPGEPEPPGIPPEPPPAT
ncbi:Tbingi protein [Trypanosoma cruzi]|nr:Tbingi protein [Trypanosoma cruzi]